MKISFGELLAYTIVFVLLVAMFVGIVVSMHTHKTLDRDSFQMGLWLAGSIATLIALLSSLYKRYQSDRSEESRQDEKSSASAN